MSPEADTAIVIVGLPQSLRPLIEREFKGRAIIRCILMRRDGGFRLELPPARARGLIDDVTDGMNSFDQLLIVELPYARVPPEVCATTHAAEGLGGKVMRPKPGAGGWPSRPTRLDKDFQDELLRAICSAVAAWLPEESTPDCETEVCFEVLRGLVTHSKMGPNNHSHEDDLLRSRGLDLGPGGRRRVVDRLLAEGLIARKKNNSAGGTGWVYWVADVHRACELFPQLRQYL